LLERRNIYTTTLWIVDWNIHILGKMVKRNFQKGIVKKGLFVILAKSEDYEPLKIEDTS
jgi:hypothetical protein